MPRSRSRGGGRSRSDGGRHGSRAHGHSRPRSRQRRRVTARSHSSASSRFLEVVKQRDPVAKHHDVKSLSGFDQKPMLPEDFVMQQQLASIPSQNMQAWLLQSQVQYAMNPEVEAFLAANPVEPHGAGRLRSLPPGQQALIISRSLAGARDPTAVLVGRIRSICGPTNHHMGNSVFTKFNGVAQPTHAQQEEVHRPPVLRELSPSLSRRRDQERGAASRRARDREAAKIEAAREAADYGVDEVPQSSQSLSHKGWGTTCGRLLVSQPKQGKVPEEETEPKALSDSRGPLVVAQNVIIAAAAGAAAYQAEAATEPRLPVALIGRPLSLDKPLLDPSFGGFDAERPRERHEPARCFTLWGPDEVCQAWPCDDIVGGSCGSVADVVLSVTEQPVVRKVDLPAAFDPKKRKAQEDFAQRKADVDGYSFAAVMRDSPSGIEAGLLAVLEATNSVAASVSREEETLLKQQEEALAQYHWFWVQQQLQSQMELVEAQRTFSGMPPAGALRGPSLRGPGQKGVERPSTQPKLPGDWNCPNCGDHQFMRNRMCRACGALRPPDI